MGQQRDFLLDYLADRPLTWISITAMERARGVTNGGVCKALYNLVKYGYVERSEKRKYKITTKGLEVTGKIIPLIHQGWEWTCPNCHVHTEIDHIPQHNAVKCDICGGAFVIREHGPYPVPSSAITEEDIEALQYVDAN